MSRKLTAAMAVLGTVALFGATSVSSARTSHHKPHHKAHHKRHHKAHHKKHHKAHHKHGGSSASVHGTYEGYAYALGTKFLNKDRITKENPKTGAFSGVALDPASGRHVGTVSGVVTGATFTETVRLSGGYVSYASGKILRHGAELKGSFHDTNGTKGTFDLSRIGT